MNIEQHKYPIGQFLYEVESTDLELDEQISVIKAFPQKLKKLVEGWSDEQLDTRYRHGGWTVRQLVNHMADSHMNSFTRFKLALTEENPTIKPYNEAAWAELQDSYTISIKPAIYMLVGIHARWVYELISLTNKELESTFFHPEQNKKISLRESVAFYAWHCNHHYAHIEKLKILHNWK